MRFNKITAFLLALTLVTGCIIPAGAYDAENDSTDIVSEAEIIISDEESDDEATDDTESEETENEVTEDAEAVEEVEFVEEAIDVENENTEIDLMDVDLQSEQEREEYTIEIQNAVYLEDGFDNSDSYSSDGTGSAEVVMDDSDKGMVLSVSDETEVTYSFAGSTVKWDGEAVSDAFVGDGTEESPYLIKNGADLKLLQVSVNSGETYEGQYFKLLNNIDLQNYNWDPIGNASNIFKGNFDGNYNKVINIKRVSTSEQLTRLGFFGDVRGSLKNFGVENVEIEVKCTQKNTYAGGVTGYFGGIMDNCYARNVKITNTSSDIGLNLAGGIAGYVRYETTIQNSYVVDFEYDTKITGDKVGAMFGYLKSNNGIINVYNCYVAGEYILNGPIDNYYAIAAEEKHSNVKSGNNYVAHGVEKYQTSQTQREVNCEVVNETKMSELAADLSESFAKDETGLINKGFPYHKQCLDIPDEVIIGFDINFETSDCLSFSILNPSGYVCVDESIENTFSDGWHSVDIDMKDGQYSIYIDSELVKSANALSDIGHSKIIFLQEAGKSCKLDNISVKKDYTDDLTFTAEKLLESIKEKCDINNITDNVELPAYYSTDIEWFTSDKRIMDDSGNITRHAVKLPVVMTAKYDGNSTAGISKPSAVVNFNMYVAPEEDASDSDKASDIVTYYLKEELLTDESLDFITKDLKELPKEYEGAAITWESANPDVISDDGKVILPQIDGDDAEVTLTATVTVNGISSTTEFHLVVPAPLSDIAKVRLAMDDMGYERLTTEEVNKITKNLTLPKKGLYDANITWSSSNADVIADDGTVTRTDEDTFVQLTATFEINGASDEKVYSFNVLISEIAAAQQDADLIFEQMPEAVSENFLLPQTGAKHGSSITWESDGELITINGNTAVVTRPSNEDGDTAVLLRATVTYGTASEVTEVFVNVLKLPPGEELINEAYESITWESISADEITLVKNNLSLRTEFENDVTAIWSSEPSGYIDPVTGIVSRPKLGESDVNVKLTVIVGQGVSPVTKTFDVTVKAFESDEEALQKATDELSFNILSSDPIDSLYNNLYLPVEWRYGTTISWTSSEPSYINVSGEDGIVTSPEFATENKTVTLKAEISLGSIKNTKEFYITLAENDGIKEVFNIDYESYELGELKSVDNITVYKQYVGASIAEDPVNPGNKVIKLNKNKTFAASAQKGTRFSTVGESKGSFELTTRLYFEKLPDRSFYVCGAFNTGEEITLSIKKSGDGVSIAGKVVPFGEWIDFKLTFDTTEKKYKVYVNDEFLKEYNFKYVDSKSAARSFSRFYFDFVYQTASGEHIVYMDDTRFVKNVYCKDALTEASTRFETEFLTRQDIKNITTDLIIPEISINELTIETKSSDTAVVTDDGKVTRPLDDDAVVDFTVRYINKYGSTREKVFKLVVKGGTREHVENSSKALSDITDAVNFINDNHTLTYITGDLKLLLQAAYGSTLTYTSSDERVISNTGKVTRPLDKDREVTLTVKAEKGDAVEIRTVKFFVKRAQTVQPQGGGSGGSGGGELPPNDADDCRELPPGAGVCNFPHLARRSEYTAAENGTSLYHREKYPCDF